MEIVLVKSVKEYSKFIKELYRSDPFFKNNKSGLLNIVCNSNGEFNRNTIQKMIAVEELDRIMCMCVLNLHKSYKDSLSVSFFEAREDADGAVEYMMDYAADIAHQLGCKRIIVSLDGHCNNSVGFLRDSEQEFPTFGASYNPEYYHKYFESKYIKVDFTSYYDSVENVYSNVQKSLAIIQGNKDEFTLEYANFSASGFEKTMKRYTDLNNQIFTNHKYYFYRTYKEDLELFSAMKLLLRPSNLIFAKQGDADIGFILWYPDYNELVSPQKQAGVKTYIKYILLKQHIKKVMVVEIGVQPQYQGSGVILMLLAEAISKIHSKTQTIISSWILDENTKSKLITKRFMKNTYKRFVAYEREV